MARLALVAFVLLVAGCGSAKQESSATATATEALPADTITTAGSCLYEQQAGIAAVFGHRSTQGEAETLLQKAEVLGFEGLEVQTRSCSDYAVVLRGLRNLAQGRELRAEAASVHLPVQIECRSLPLRGGLNAVFGHRRTRRAARQLEARARRHGFLHLQIQQDECGDWEVDLPGLTTPAQRREFKAEAASVGLHVTFEPG